MAATLFVLGGLLVYIVAATLAERFLPAHVMDKICRFFGIEEGL